MIVSAVPVPQATLPDDPGRLTLAEYYAQVYQPTASPGWRGPSSPRNYVAATRAFARYAGEISVSTITPKALDDFRQWLVESGCTPKTVEGYTGLCRTLLHRFDAWRFPEQFRSRGHQHQVDGRRVAGSIWCYFETVFKPAKEAAGHWRGPLAEKHYRVCINLLCQFAQRPIGMDEIRPELLDRFGDWAIGRGVGKQTTRNYLGMLRTLMRHYSPERFPKIPTYTAPEPMPRIPQPPAPPDDDWTKAGQVQQVNPAWRDWTLMDYFVRQYAQTHEMGRSYYDNLRTLVDRFSAWLGRQAELSDLADATVNQWLIALGETALSKARIHNLRVLLLTLWRDAFENCVVQHPPRRVRKIRVPRTTPVAWTVDQVRQLLTVAAAERGCFRKSGVVRGLFWLALITVAFETGLRFGDLLRLRREQIAVDGSLRVVQHKTGNEIVCRIRPATLAAIDATRPGSREFVFGGALSYRRLQCAFKQIVRKADLVGSFKKLRKSGATAVERETPGAATAFLGHRSPQVAAAHYIDPTIARQEVRLPPCLTPSLG
ncbi:MAG: tyrosine-type recombinase/integrase [Pirellulales bacterium]